MDISPNGPLTSTVDTGCARLTAREFFDGGGGVTVMVTDGGMDSGERPIFDGSDCETEKWRAALQHCRGGTTGPTVFLAARDEARIIMVKCVGAAARGKEFCEVATPSAAAVALAFFGKA